MSKRQRTKRPKQLPQIANSKRKSLSRRPRGTWDDAEQRPSCAVAGATEEFHDWDKKEKQKHAQHEKKIFRVEKRPKVPGHLSFLHIAAP